MNKSAFCNSQTDLSGVHIDLLSAENDRLKEALQATKANFDELQRLRMTQAEEELEAALRASSEKQRLFEQIRQNMEKRIKDLQHGNPVMNNLEKILKAYSVLTGLQIEECEDGSLYCIQKGKTPIEFKLQSADEDIQGYDYIPVSGPKGVGNKPVVFTFDQGVQFYNDLSKKIKKK